MKKSILMTVVLLSGAAALANTALADECDDYADKLADVPMKQAIEELQTISQQRADDSNYASLNAAMQQKEIRIRTDFGRGGKVHASISAECRKTLTADEVNEILSGKKAGKNRELSAKAAGLEQQAQKMKSDAVSENRGKW